MHTNLSVKTIQVSISALVFTLEITSLSMRNKGLKYPVQYKLSLPHNFITDANKLKIISAKMKRSKPYRIGSYSSSFTSPHFVFSCLNIFDWFGIFHRSRKYIKMPPKSVNKMVRLPSRVHLEFASYYFMNLIILYNLQK